MVLMVRPVFGGSIPDGIYDLGPALGGCQSLHVRLMPAHRYSIVRGGQMHRVRLCGRHAAARIHEFVMDRDHPDHARPWDKAF